MRAFLRLLRRHALVRLFVVQSLIGFGISTAFVLALLVFNLGGFASLALRAGAWPFVIVLWFFVGLTFASVQMGMAIMSLVGDPPPGGGKRLPVEPTLAPVRVARPGAR